MLKAEALRVDGKSFAYLSETGLVLKLPKATVDRLIAEARGTALTVGTRVMKEWVVVPPSESDHWQGLMAEAMGFVGGAG
ncbi:hypothetical protein E2K80_10825 [Rhodophyticola sp. CCM32]|nr:hypothetical protein E2K80_10825 [Rhodophyticola sp. CCM32]